MIYIDKQLDKNYLKKKKLIEEIKAAKDTMSLAKLNKIIAQKHWPKDFRPNTTTHMYELTHVCTHTSYICTPLANSTRTLPPTGLSV